MDQVVDPTNPPGKVIADLLQAKLDELDPDGGDETDLQPGSAEMIRQLRSTLPLFKNLNP